MLTTLKTQDMKRDDMLDAIRYSIYAQFPNYREFKESQSRTATAANPETIDIECEVIEPKQIDENQIKRAEDELTVHSNDVDLTT